MRKQKQIIKNGVDKDELNKIVSKNTFSLKASREDILSHFKEIKDDLTFFGNGKYVIPQQHYNNFKNYAECYKHINNGKIKEMFIQHSGTSHDGIMTYPGVSSSEIRILLIFKEKGFSSFYVNVEQKDVTVPVPINIVMQYGIVLPKNMSNITIPYGKNITEHRVSLCQTTFVLITFEPKNDQPLLEIAENFMDSSDENATKMVEKISQRINDGNLSKTLKSATSSVI